MGKRIDIDSLYNRLQKFGVKHFDDDYVSMEIVRNRFGTTYKTYISGSEFFTATTFKDTLDKHLEYKKYLEETQKEFNCSKETAQDLPF